jgi:hypothetical protein
MWGPSCQADNLKGAGDAAIRGGEAVEIDLLFIQVIIGRGKEMVMTRKSKFT